MDESNTEPKGPLERKKRNTFRFKKTLIYAVYRSVVEFSGSAAADYFERNWKVVNRVATTVPGVLVLLFALGGVCGFFLKGCQSDAIISEKEKVYGEIKENLSDTKRERDKLEIELKNKESALSEAQNALAPWKQLANSKYPDEPFNKRMDLLFEQMSKMTQDFASVSKSLNAVVSASAGKTSKDRLRACLNSIDPRITEALKSQDVRFNGPINVSKIEELQKLLPDPEASQFFTMKVISDFSGMVVGDTKIGSQSVELFIHKTLMEQK